MVSENTLHSIEKLRSILSDAELFAPLDYHFALFIARLAKKHNYEAALAAALVSSRTSAGNICIDLDEYADKPLPITTGEKTRHAFICPTLSDWSKCLLKSGVVGQNAGNSPLVLDKNGRLYLRRYWEYENSIIRFVQQRAAMTVQDLNYSTLAEDIKRLFQPHSHEVDWQKIAAVAAVTKPFCVISGGPGTGKTSTVAKILSLLAGQNNSSRQLRILLGAPTGKAASRLQEAISIPEITLKGLEPLQASTLHRMLGYIPNSPYFRHNGDNPLAADVVVIDEASMVDLPLMAKLMQALPAATRLILLGDHHQLASVQPGSVLGDICRSDIMSTFSSEFRQQIPELSDNSLQSPSQFKAAGPSTLQDSFVELIQSYRFPSDSGIARLSRAVKEGNGESALDILLDKENSSVSWSDLPPAPELSKKVRNWPMITQFASMQQALEPASCFSVLDSFRILCALRIGPYGMEKINDILEQQFAQQVSAQPGQSNIVLPVRPIMVTENDYNLQLFNGDVGIIQSPPDSQQSLRVFFRDNSGTLRNIAPALLPAHETVFAMTVHKSQGSEFDTVLLILPDRDSPLLTRELLYTAITRARKKVEIWGKKEIFRSAVKRQIKRTSGLSEALWD